MEKKRVLYIGPPVFNYHTKIKEEFERQGYEVTYYDDRPSESSLVKGIIRVKRSLVKTLTKNYFNKILEETRKTRYDLVFIINCKVFTPEMILRLRESLSGARFVYYMWDSLTLYPHCRKLISLFDKTYTFDLKDCETVEGLHFLPLFYDDEYESVGQMKSQDWQYDMVSVCTVHPNRYKIIRGLFPELEAKGVRIYSYMFINKLQYLYNKVKAPEFKAAKKKEFQFAPLSKQQYLDILKKTNTVFDIPHDKQSGLTMRTIETLGAKRKMITTNANIKKYDFYSEDNIFVLDENNRNEIVPFLEKVYKPFDSDVYKKYSLASFIKTIIIQADNQYIK